VFRGKKFDLFTLVRAGRVCHGAVTGEVDGGPGLPGLVVVVQRPGIDAGHR